MFPNPTAEPAVVRMMASLLPNVPLFFHLNKSELVKEYKQDTDGTHVIYKENVEVEQSSVSQCPHICKFVANYLVWHIPSDKDTC